MKAINTEDRLPEENTYVLCHHTRGTWHDRDDPEGVNWVVAKFIRTEDPEGNNKKPYKWDCFGPDCFFGQVIDKWCPLPRTNKGD